MDIYISFKHHFLKCLQITIGFPIIAFEILKIIENKKLDFNNIKNVVIAFIIIGIIEIIKLKSNQIESKTIPKSEKESIDINFEKLKELIKDKEEFDMTMLLIELRIKEKFANNFFYTREEVKIYFEKLIIEEILKRH